MKRRVGAWLAVLSISALVATAIAQESGPLTSAERQRLVAGELVRRPVARREGAFQYLGGTSFLRIHASRERVWADVIDPANWPVLIPALDEARIVEEHGSTRIAYMQHRYAFVVAGYHARVVVDQEAYTIRFDLDPTRPHDVRAGRGFITVDRYRRRESMVTWGVMADPGAGILSGLLGPLMHDWILRVPECVRDHVELGTGC